MLVKKTIRIFAFKLIGGAAPGVTLVRASRLDDSGAALAIGTLVFVD